MRTNTIKIGSTVTGCVARKGFDGRMRSPYVLLDIADFKYAADLPVEEAAGLELGDSIEVRLTGINEDLGLASVSRNQLLEDRAWEQINQDVQSRTTLSFKPETITRGGIIGKINDHLEGFLPASKTNVKRFHELSRMLNQEEIAVVALEAERERGNVLVSMNAALEIKQEEILSHYQVGEIYTLPVVGIAEFGIFLALDPANTMTGLLHASELSYRAGKQDPKKYTSIGSEITVKLVKITQGKDGHKVAFSLKKLFDPWSEAAEQMQAGQDVTGKVINVQDNLGSFISLGNYPRVVGLLRDHYLKRGQEVIVKLETFAPNKQKARLSLVSSD